MSKTHSMAMGGMPAEPGERAFINVYTSKEFRDELQRLAMAEGVTLSTYTRAALFEAARRSRDRKRKRTVES